jgi:hypothetical protein
MFGEAWSRCGPSLGSDPSVMMQVGTLTPIYAAQGWLWDLVLLAVSEPTWCCSVKKLEDMCTSCLVSQVS